MVSEIIRVALAPVLRIAKLRLDQADTFAPIPDGPPRAHAAGVDTFRILIVGDGVARGIGVRSHELALPGYLARTVSRRMGRGVDIDVVTAPRLPLSGIVSEIRRHHPGRFDAIVITTGSEEALLHEPVQRWRSRLTAAITEVASLVSPETVVLVCGIPATHRRQSLPTAIARMADAHAHSLDTASREVCAGLPATRFVPLIPGRVEEGALTPATSLYSMWADAIAQRLASGRVGIHHNEGPADNEVERQAAVDRMAFDTQALDPVLQKIVATARRAFGTESAMFTVLDRDLQRHVARSNVSLTELPRSYAFCQHVIVQEGGMVIEDATLDQRFHDNPLVTGDVHLRFYAGFPVDSPDGERVGALCVFDSSPRAGDEVDLALLREFAILVQNELWRFLTVTVDTTPRLRRLSQPWITQKLVALESEPDQHSDAIH